ncbi:hypothetical protein LEP1GSC193_3644 [Leptospira alstonii serovar Pingchang str. 80-412]|uniref:Uncharacterized protein n=2 Tax=Leptospira alstonii TaxID=28452 RepID=M6CRS8_9LEPT|nr:hypothetical protein LEP1GSC194_0778 [Leptospira alstonii serovar Sichuan str. 79601]EQA81264.1 hypothetical protein LEP1GSC193_3644 [Leptospira alstonii serovar Pingchang str. 80-412]
MVSFRIRFLLEFPQLQSVRKSNRTPNVLGDHSLNGIKISFASF